MYQRNYVKMLPGLTHFCPIKANSVEDAVVKLVDDKNFIEFAAIRQISTFSALETM